MTTTTREALIALVAAHDAARVAAQDGNGDVDATITQIDAVMGSGTPANEAFAESLGVDYVCALDDGTIAAWGDEFVLGHRLVGRELVFYAPAEQA